MSDACLGFALHLFSPRAPPHAATTSSALSTNSSRMWTRTTPTTPATPVRDSARDESYIQLSLRSTARSLYTISTNICSGCFPKVTIGYNPLSATYGRGAACARGQIWRRCLRRADYSDGEGVAEELEMKQKAKFKCKTDVKFSLARPPPRSPPPPRRPPPPAPPPRVISGCHFGKAATEYVSRYSTQRSSGAAK